MTLMFLIFFLFLEGGSMAVKWHACATNRRATTERDPTSLSLESILEYLLRFWRVRTSIEWSEVFVIKFA